MTSLLIAMEGTLLGVRAADHGDAWVSDDALSGVPCRCIAADPALPRRVYLGTADRGLLRSDDGGRAWRPVGDGIRNSHITAVAVSEAELGEEGGGVVHAGTEPSALYRSEDGGRSWRELPGLLDLPSAGTWSFPPRPDTHHVRWIAPDPHVPGRLFAAIEAGALVRSGDGGHSWEDRRPDGPIDTHTLVVHPRVPDRLYSAAGDGYFESHDGGESWRKPETGLAHRYAWGCAVGPEDPDTVVISAARSARQAHAAAAAESWIYRRTAGRPWEAVREGLPEPEGTTITTLISDPDASGVLYAANNRGVFRSADVGATWERLEVEWPEPFRLQRVAGVAALGGD